MQRVGVAALLALLVLCGCTAPQRVPAGPTSSLPPRETPTGPFAVSSDAFQPQQPIPRKYSCDADNVSPPLALTNAPLNASHLALIMDDPDAPSGAVTHWTFWNLPANVTRLSEHADVKPYGATEGQAYRGPCPPLGTHRYFFHAYATNGTLDLKSGSSASELRSALQGRVAAQAEMYGTYTRPQIPPGAA